MPKHLFALSAALLLATLGNAEATPDPTITINLGPPPTTPWSPKADEIRSYSFTTLNGIQLAGQPISIEIVFDFQQWQFASFRYFDFTLVLGTDIGGPTSWSGVYQGIGASGLPVNGGANRVEFVADANGNLVAKLIGWDTGDQVYRAHLDLSLPNAPGHTITSGRMDQQGHPVPEPGTWLLLSLGLGGVILKRRARG